MLEHHLRVHWRASRPALLCLATLALALPILSVQGAGTPVDAWGRSGGAALALVQAVEGWTPLFPLLAFALGCVLGLTAWSWDHRAGHVYALSLPVPRTRYVLEKMLAGAALLSLPVGCLAVGALAATSLVEIPPELRAQPLAVTARFGLAALLAYALLFTMASATVRFTLALITGVVGLALASTLVVAFLAGTVAPELAGVSPAAWVLDAVGAWPGPFSVFTGNWMLIDV